MCSSDLDDIQVMNTSTRSIVYQNNFELANEQTLIPRVLMQKRSSRDMVSTTFTLTVNQSTVSVDPEILPYDYALHRNYPNPFNPITTLRYDLPENSEVNITIYDIMGREVRSLVNQTQDAGFKSVVWNATNDLGQPVSAGMYLYRISAGDFVQVKKMVLLK